MVNVLIVGATGYVGSALCQSLVRSGNHRVYGLARTEEKAKQLAAEEIIPVVGSIEKGEELAKAINEFRISTVVDVAGADRGSHELLRVLQAIGSTRIAKSIPKLGFIYCSGTWVHGSSNDPIDDLTPVALPSSPTPPAKITSWRPALEREVLAASNVLNTLVIRPALIYGRSSAIWSIFFNTIYNGALKAMNTITLTVDPKSRPGLIHVDDVATGFHAAIEKLPLLAGTNVYPVFDLVTSQESLPDILESAAREMRYEGKVEFAAFGDDIFAEAMNTSFNGCSGRAKSILGWEPKRIGFVKGMDVFAKAWVVASHRDTQL